MKRLLLFLIIVSAICYGQTDTLLTDEIIEIYSAETETGQVTGSAEEMLSLIENPLNLNLASEIELSKIPILNDTQIKRIIEIRDSLNGFSSFDQLVLVQSLSREEITSLKSVVFIDEISDQNFEDSKHSHLEITLRNRMLGNYYKSEAGSFNDNYRVYHRLLLNYGENLSFSSLIEKDPGEAKYADFSSYSLSISNLIKGSRIVLGDYSVLFGQGLSIWSAYASVKSSQAVSGISRNSRNIKSYKSSNEFRFFRGIAASVEFSGLTISSYYSSKYLDATLSENGQIENFRQSGYHITENDINYRNNVRENFTGLIIGLPAISNFRLSYMYGQTKFNRDFAENSNYNFVPDIYNIHSIGYNFYKGKLEFSGETSFAGGFASINNLELNISRKTTVVFSQRYCSENYFSFYSSAFGESSSLFKLEKGFYTGIKINTGYGIINSYYDFFQIKRKYEDIFPYFGNEFMLSYRVYPLRKVMIGTVYKHKTKETSWNDEVVFDKSDKLRIETICTLFKNIRLKTRYEKKMVSPEDEKGDLFYQDIKYTPLKDLSINLRFVLYKTTSYSSAIYEFENDLPGVFYNPPLYGEGIKWYVNTKYKIFDFIFALKYSEQIQLGAFKNETKPVDLYKTKCRFGLQIEYSSAF